MFARSAYATPGRLAVLAGGAYRWRSNICSGNRGCVSVALTDAGAAQSGPSDGRNGVDRQPPPDLTGEQSVLGGICRSKRAIAAVVAVLRPSDYYRPAHQLVYDLVRALCIRGEPADASTVAADLE